MSFMDITFDPFLFVYIQQFASVRNRVALFEMHISESGSSTELEPKSPSKSMKVQIIIK